MKRLFMLVALAVSCSPYAYSQGLPSTLKKSDDNKQSSTAQPCKLSVAESPEIRGFKLGLTVSEFKKNFPSANLPEPDEVGERLLYINSAYPYGMELTGTKSVTLQFLDDKLVEFKIVYDDSVRWFKVDDFVVAINRPLNLPEGWIGNRYDRDIRELNCHDFIVSAKVSIFREATLTVAEKDVLKKIIERRANLEKKRQKEFKP